MTAGNRRVGIVGADAKASWASMSHVDAVKGVPGLELAAIATRHEESARAAAEAFGVPRWFGDAMAMIRDPEIDIVTVAVRVPAHRDLVLAALDAGKAVYCEAPLGVSVDETATIAAAVGSRHAVIGLQARLNPSARRAAELIAAGAIGRPLNARIVSTTVGGGPNTLSAYDYFNKTESGANILTIAGGHTLDLIETVLGEIVNVDARAEVLWPTVSVLDTGGTSKRETPDHVDVLGRTASGAIFVADIVSGAPMDEPRFEFEIRGSEGWLKLTGGHPYGFQAGDLTLTASVEFESPDRPVVEGGLMGAAINVGEVYARLLSDLRDGTHSAPDFALALHNSRLTDAVAHASKSGQRQAVPK